MGLESFMAFSEKITASPPPPWHLLEDRTSNCILRLLLGFRRHVLTCVIKYNDDIYFNRLLVYNIIRKMAIFPYFLIIICCTRSLCHDCFITLGWSTLYFNMLKITSRLKIELSVIYSEGDFYWIYWNELHEAVQLTIYLCIFF